MTNKPFLSLPKNERLIWAVHAIMCLEKILLIIIFIAIGLVSCRPNEHRFFMRYISNDPEKLEKDINEKAHDLKQAHGEYETFVKSIDLSEYLTIAGRERESIELLQPYIENGIKNAADEDLAWLYLNYATASQYAKKSNNADKYFKKALSLGEEKDLQAVTHYILHHYGRFLVEQKEYDRARQCFEKALSIRQRLNDQRVASTQKAIDSLDIILKRANH
jgi:tetratricopeptide (TPR) repeat protein